MLTNKYLISIIVFVLTILSGFGDSQGFLHATKMWSGGKLVFSEFLKSSLGYIFGIIMYWFAIRFLNEIKALPAEVQTLGWFIVTIVGVAIFSGEFLKWSILEKFISVIILIGLAWLMARTGG